ncbi:putative TIR domain, P-loop containing nucleoside triphosphate hydrolase [Helianthus annuus]|nr:putative TIR domain, P-loop containing nucleoside triphosphate hydrolase [Helianthus annuus]
MASTSSSSIQKRFKYDVFLSFRGEDTRKNFVDYLYHVLKQKGIYTYKDDEEIKKGKAISDELIRSIEDSKFYIIVFSKNYASSSWCLEELVKIMQCHEMNGQTAYPVFYDVEPTEVRNQSGAVGEAFAKHVNEELAGRWRDALKQASSLAGWELKNTFDGHQAKCIQKIVEVISLELRCINYSVDGKLVGMERRVKDGSREWEELGLTTLARVVFDQISFQFKGSSFVENVRENSKNPMCGLKTLQKQVLSDVLKNQDITVNGVYEGKNMMKQRMCSRKVLVVLDDVDHIDQLEALAGEHSWFKPGSRVIITTREEQVLVAHGVPMNMILDVNLLSHVEANCLFSRYAFGREAPTQGYKELSGQVVRYAAGLPLTIKVLGSFLRGKDELEWTDALERLKTIPLKETLEILELSYYGLEDDYKEIFLDVACILKGWEKERAIRALESRDFHARSGLRVLEQKSLITLSRHGRLGMHDHIVEMGKNIVRRLYPNLPNRHSRLWIKEETENILVEDKGTEAIRCMTVEFLDPVIVMRGLRKMQELEFLEVKGSSNLYRRRSFNFDNIDEDSLHLPYSLRYLCWHGYPFTCLPKKFLANNLVGLEMHHSNINQLWIGGEKKALKKIRFIDLSCCELRTLDIGLAMNLERLHLEQCSNLVDLHVPIESKLKFLSIRHCTQIRTLDLVRAQKLDILIVEECEDVVELHMPVDSLKLKHLSLQRCKLKILNLMWTQNLENLHLGQCSNLVELHMPINLDTLNVVECEDLEELHMPVESLKLKHLSLQWCKLRTLNLTQAQNLKNLSLECDDLLELHMSTESPELNQIVIGCSKLRTLYLGLSPYLEHLDLYYCSNLVEFHAQVGCLSGSVRFKPCLVKQGFRMSGSLPELHLTARPLGTCPLHPDNNLPKFHFECTYKELLLSSTENLAKLISLGLCACTNLASLSRIICGVQLRKLTLEGSIPEVPKELNQLECLEELNLLSTNIEHVPDSIATLKHLKFLQFKSCRFLKQLPENIGRLECLEELHFTDCTSLRDIPNSICEMKRLKCFHLTDCILVEKLPKEIGRLKCLQVLNIKGTGIRDFPPNISQLEDLTILF